MIALGFQSSLTREGGRVLEIHDSSGEPSNRSSVIEDRIGLDRPIMVNS